MIHEEQEKSIPYTLTLFFYFANHRTNTLGKTRFDFEGPIKRKQSEKQETKTNEDFS